MGIFSRGKAKSAKAEQADGAPAAKQEPAPEVAEELTDKQSERAAGPYDSTEVGDDDPLRAISRLDLGSVSLPLPAGGQVQVEMTPEGTVSGVHLGTPHGRITVVVFAAPRSSGQWREVAGELTESLRNDRAEVAVETGPWGRELVAKAPAAELRFIGVDGPRWMIRCVTAGPAGANAATSELTKAARQVLAGTIVNRGSDPLPIRSPLPITLPQQLQQQLAAAQQQQAAQLAAQQAAQQQAAPPAAPGTADDSNAGAPSEAPQP